MDLIFKMRTPLWTGDANKLSGVGKETGVMGSLRWWYRAIILGLQRSDVDIGDDSDCHSHVDMLFGTTDWSRRFRLTLAGGMSCYNDSNPINIKPHGRTRGWYLGNGLKGNISAGFEGLYPGYDIESQLLPLITLISRWGGLGARTQHGYGVILAAQDAQSPELSQDSSSLNRFISMIKGRWESGNVPALQDFFFARFPFQADPEWYSNVDGLNPGDNRIVAWTKHSVPVSPAVKNQLRYNPDFRPSSIYRAGNSAIDYLFGTTHGNERIGSKINISCAYRPDAPLTPPHGNQEQNWEIRVWGWLPPDNHNQRPDGFPLRNVVLGELHGSLNNSNMWSKALGVNVLNPENHIWREFNSTRDTVIPSCGDIVQYFGSLLI